MRPNAHAHAHHRPPFASGSSDEDPYSVAGSGSSGSSGGNGGNGRSRSRDKPPKLPPRDNALYGPSLWAKPGEAGAHGVLGAADRKKNIDRRGGESDRCFSFIDSKSFLTNVSAVGSSSPAELIEDIKDVGRAADANTEPPVVCRNCLRSRF